MTSLNIPSSVEYISYAPFTDNPFTSVTFENPTEWTTSGYELDDIFSTPQKTTEFINNHDNFEYRHSSYNPGHNSRVSSGDSSIIK